MPIPHSETGRDLKSFKDLCLAGQLLCYVVTFFYSLHYDAASKYWKFKAPLFSEFSGEFSLAVHSELFY